MKRSGISNRESANQEAREREKLPSETEEAPAPAKVVGAFGTRSYRPPRREPSPPGDKRRRTRRT